MSIRRTRNESINNLDAVIDKGAHPEIVGQMDVVMADAVQESKKIEKHLQDVQNQLDGAANSVAPENPEKEETKVKNDFTAKLVLDESIEDFQLTETKKDGRANKVTDSDGTNIYLDYDMFDFIYGLVTDCYPKPANPITNIKKTKFMYIGSDNYAKRTSDAVESPLSDTDVVEPDAFDLHAQVSTSGNQIVVYNNNIAAFDWIKAVCERYKFKYSGPTPKRSASSHWSYSFSIQVPCDSGYPMMVEDYFETLGLTIEDVMDSAFAASYRKEQEKERKEAQKYLDELEVERKVQAAIVTAAQDNTESLDTHLKRLFAELTVAGLKFQKAKIKKQFMDAFDDGEEDDE